MQLTENRILVTGIGRGRAEAFPALSHKVMIEGRREKVLEQTTDADPGVASVTLNDCSGVHAQADGEDDPGIRSQVLNGRSQVLNCKGEIR